MFHVAFEGIDNSGKTTFTENLTLLLQKKGLKAIVTKELTSNVGKIIFDSFRSNKNISPQLKTFLFAADRLIRFEKIVSMDYDIVIWDRYIYSALVYREMENQDIEWVRNVNSIFPDANLTYYIDINPKDAIKRGKLAKRTCPYDEKELSICRDIYKRYVNCGEMIEIRSQDTEFMTDIVMKDLEKLYVR